MKREREEKKREKERESVKCNGMKKLFILSPSKITRSKHENNRNDNKLLSH